MSRRTSILVSEETHQWLCAERDRLIRDAERCGGYVCPAYREETVADKPPISLEAVLLILLDDRQRHRERRRKAARKRRAERKRLIPTRLMERDGLIPR